MDLNQFLKENSLENESWKTIPKYERYMVSDKGRVLSLCTKKPKILKVGRNKDGYSVIDLRDGSNKKSTYYIHRLVTAAFIGECPKDYYVNHINEIKNDNRVENLEYVTPKQNANHGSRNKKLSKIVEQYNLTNDLLATYCSTHEAARVNSMSQGHIADCCRGVTKTAYGYIWRYQ